MKRLFIVPILLLSLVLAGSALAAPAESSHTAFPDTIALPDGFFPEGIVVGKGANFYTGSLINGTIFRGDLRSGHMLGTSDPLDGGQLSVGLAFDERTNFVYAASGFGPTGKVAVFDGNSLELLYNIELSNAAGMVNDVTVTREAAYLTDSFAPVMYRVGLTPGSALPNPADVSTIPLSGFTMAPGFNANGIVATGGDRWLVIVNSATGDLYRVDPGTGVSQAIDLGGDSLLTGDGLVLNGNILYVVHNFPRQVTVIELMDDFSRGVVLREIPVPNSDTPTTADLFGSHLYVVDARFSTPPPAVVSYEITKIGK